MAALLNALEMFPFIIQVVLVQTTLLLGLALAVVSLTRRRSAAYRSAVLRMALIAVVAAPLLTVQFSSMGVNGVPLREAAPPVLALHAVDGPRAAPMTGSFPVADRTGSVLPALPSGTFADEEAAVSAREARPAVAWIGSIRLEHGLAALWFGVAAFLLLRLGVAIGRLRQVRQRSETASPIAVTRCGEFAAELGVRSPEVRVSDDVRGPCLCGLLRPVILLPPGLAATDPILVHELAHLKRRDLWWKYTARFVCAVLFFQPLAWLMARRMEAVDDEVADDLVLAKTGDAATYARCLVEVAETYRSARPEAVAGLGVVSFRSGLGRRVERILDTTRRLRVRTGFRVASAIVLAAVLLTGMAGLIGAEGRREVTGAPNPNIAGPGMASAGPRLTNTGPGMTSQGPGMPLPGTIIAGTPGAATYTITGRILDPEGNLVSGARVMAVNECQAMGSPGGVREYSEDAGRFTIVMEAGPCYRTVTAWHREYSTSAPVELTGEDQEVDIHLRWPVYLMGRVTSAQSGETVDEFGILLQDTDSTLIWPSYRTAAPMMSGSRGKLQVPVNVAPLLDGERDQMPYAVIVKSERLGIAAISVTLTDPGKDIEALEVILPGEFVLRGQVLDESQAPVASASVCYGVPASGHIRGFLAATTDAEGRFVIGDLPAVMQTISVYHPDHAPLVFDIGPGDAESELTLTMEQGGTITGTLTMEGADAATPPTSVSVTAHRLGEAGGYWIAYPLTFPASPDEDGNYRIDSLPSGDYRLVAEVRRFAGKGVQLEGTYQAKEERGISVLSGQQRIEDFHLEVKSDRRRRAEAEANEILERLDSGTPEQIERALNTLNFRDFLREAEYRDLAAEIGDRVAVFVFAAEAGETAIRALGALTMLGSGDAAVERIRLLLLSDDDRTVAAAAMAIGAAGDSARPAMVDLVPLLIHDDESVRSAAVWAIDRLGPVGAAGLAEALEDEDAGTRRAAAEFLAKLGVDAYPYMDHLERVADNDADEEVRKTARLAVKLLEPWNVQTLDDMRVRAAWSGDNSRIVEQEYHLIEDAESWKELWRRHTGGTMEAPGMAFGQVVVVAVFGGQSVNCGGYEFADDIESEDGLTIRLRPLSYQTMQLGDDVTPYGFVVVDKPEGEVIVEMTYRVTLASEEEWEEVVRFAVGE